MPLPDAFNQTSTGATTPIKLPKMSSIPTTDDLSRALNQAVQNPSIIVELPWKSATNPNNYIIRVSCQESVQEPSWYLHVGGDEDDPVVWNYDTPDANLIHSLVSAECERTTYTAPLVEQEPSSLSDRIRTSSGANTSLEWTQSGTSFNQFAPSAVPNSNFTQSSSQLTPIGTTSSALLRPLPPAVDLNRAAVDGMYKSFTIPETGFVSHAAFLFFLVNEFNRYQRDPKPLSVVRFEMCIRPMSPDSGPSSLPPNALQEASKRIFSTMRTLDWVAHYESEFAMLLPLTDRLEANQIVQRASAAVLASPLIPGLESRMLGVAFGIASMPADCSHPGILLAAAQEAKNRARKANVPVMLFNDG